MHLCKATGESRDRSSGGGGWASAAVAGLQRRRDLWREEEWKSGKRGKREKEKERERERERERINLMKRK